MAEVNLGYKIVHQNGDLPPRAAEYTQQLVQIANSVIAGVQTVQGQIAGVAHSAIKLQVDSPKKDEKGKQSVATFNGDVIDKQFKRAIKKAQDQGLLQGLTITLTASGRGSAEEKKGPDCYLDRERVAWDITSEAQVTQKYIDYVKGQEEIWDAFIVIPY